MQVSESNNDVYRSFFRSCRLVLQTEGPKGFFKGVTPAMIAASGSWGGYFYFYEWSKSRKLMDSEVGSKLGTLSHVSSTTRLVEFSHNNSVLFTALFNAAQFTGEECCSLSPVVLLFIHGYDRYMIIR